MPGRKTDMEEVHSLEASEPLVGASARKIHRVRPGPVRETYFTLRLAPQEMDRLARVAAGCHTRPGTLARELILAGLERLEEAGSLEERVAAMEQELHELRRQVGAG